jgi:hypothetical protein
MQRLRMNGGTPPLLHMPVLPLQRRCNLECLHFVLVLCATVLTGRPSQQRSNSLPRCTLKQSAVDQPNFDRMTSGFCGNLQSRTLFTVLLPMCQFVSLLPVDFPSCFLLSLFLSSRAFSCVHSTIQLCKLYNTTALYNTPCTLYNTAVYTLQYSCTLQYGCTLQYSYSA